MRLRPHIPALTREPSRLLAGANRARTRPGSDATPGLALAEVQPSREGSPSEDAAAPEQEMVPVRMMQRNLRQVRELQYFVYFALAIGWLLLAEHTASDVGYGHATYNNV